TREEFAKRFGLDAKRPIVAVLPGSRPSEIRRSMPIIAEACARVQKDSPVQFALVVAPGLDEHIFDNYDRSDLQITSVAGAVYDALAAADCAVVSSGTATVEAALLGTPMVVVYRLSGLTAAIARQLVLTPLFAMVNLISGRQVAPELIQDRFTAEALEREIRRLLDSPEARAQQKRDLAEVRLKLGPGGAIERAAEVIASML
ncbi:MAG: lipid-A-disaccharide synthase, partial [Candidatus Acidiferrales bacterium]